MRLVDIEDMESRHLKQAVKALLGDYIGQKLRENSFDPKGTESSTTLDDLVHDDLTIRVALWWLEVDDGCDVLNGEIISRCLQYPDCLECEAVILSAFARLILDTLSVEEILTLYRCKPAASFVSQNYKKNNFNCWDSFTTASIASAMSTARWTLMLHQLIALSGYSHSLNHIYRAGRPAGSARVPVQSVTPSACHAGLLPCRGALQEAQPETETMAF
ncbi:uncharacterized protein C2orf80-like [Thalassophryne amazonica]|uniref:uncharacterized protein C2orf80-like n=1 Tax=Thalassophryne amazonica TaxID=390379 RepID=UPI001470EDE0|nr:uncharacterized protein C2orf80-like [Thalassophryne amazonica]